MTCFFRNQRRYARAFPAGFTQISISLQSFDAGTSEHQISSDLRMTKLRRFEFTFPHRQSLFHPGDVLRGKPFPMLDGDNFGHFIWRVPKIMAATYVL
jgi:hypothetical protein